MPEAKSLYFVVLGGAASSLPINGRGSTGQSRQQNHGEMVCQVREADAPTVVRAREANTEEIDIFISKRWSVRVREARSAHRRWISHITNPW